MLRYKIPAVSVTGQNGRIWTTRPTPGHSGLVAVLQVPASKFSEAVRAPDFTVAVMDRRADLLVTADTRGHVYVFDIRQNRFACLDKAGCAGTAAVMHRPRLAFVAFADGTIRCYDVSKGTTVGTLREHRSPVRHMELSQDVNELLSTSVDGVLVWDLKTLRRKRVLGSGPYGALQASYTPDGAAVVTHFKDGSFYVWSAGNFSLLRSFTLPVAPSLRPAQRTFCLSPDGQLLVTCGPALPVLLVYNVIAGVLRYGIGLPAQPTPLDVAATSGAVNVAAGMMELMPTGADQQSMSASAMASKLPMAMGVQQVAFLSDSATVAAMMTDGSVTFIDVLSGTFVGTVPYSFPNRPDGMFSMDARAQHMALTANGKVFLYDLAAKVTSVVPPRPLPRVLPEQLDALAAAVALEHLRRQQEPEPAISQEYPTGLAEAVSGPVSPDPQQQQQPNAPSAAPAAAGQPMPTADAGQAAAHGSALQAAGPGGSASWQATIRLPPAAPCVPVRGRRVAGAAYKTVATKPQAPFGRAISAPPAANSAAATDPLTGNSLPAPPEPDAAAVSLNRTRLEALLEAFGEYPTKYRLMIWDFLLQLPHNTASFRSLVGLGLHPTFKDMQSRLPLANRALAQRLAATLSQLAHWCPVFAESSFLPDLVFPFVKLFASAPGARGSAAMDERCFETIATLLVCGWMRSWWERFPHPPLGLLTRLQDLLALHDAPLAAHFGTYRGGLAGVVWPHLSALWTELLTRSDWLRLWDHCVTTGPELLYHFIAAYFISLRTQVLAQDTDHKLANWLAGPPSVDMGEVLKVAYLLRSRTPEDLQPVPSEWKPLPQGPTYVEFKGFPAAAVELFAADRSRIKEAEHAIMRRRAVVSELELRTRAVALQAASLSTERQQLAALEEQRQAMLRQLETETATELARLDDRAKEEKLKQIAVVEKAYQANLLEVRATWQRELESSRADLAHKRVLATHQIRNRQEDEQIKALEFHSQQRMREIDEDVRRAAMASAVRDELLTHQMEAETKHRAKLQEWETEDEVRKQRLLHEAERRAQMALVAEESAARSAAAREAMAMAMQIDDHVMKVDGKRRLQRMAEDAALATAEARAAEEARLAARTAAEKEALRLRAKADMAWYEAEQMRRDQILEQERQQMLAAADAARQKLVHTEAAARTTEAHVELLERRRHLERQNAGEEAQVRRLVGAMATERGRDAVLMLDLEAKEDEMKVHLQHYARLGSVQRDVESSEAAAAVALLAKLDEQQRRELLELRKLHDAGLERLAKEMNGLAADAAAKRRSELLAEQIRALREQQAAFELRKQEITQELCRWQGQAVEADDAARAAAPLRKASPHQASIAAPRQERQTARFTPPVQPVIDSSAGGHDDSGESRAGGRCGARPLSEVAAEAARHTRMICRVLGVGSESSTAPTLSESSALVPHGSEDLYTPRDHKYDFLSDSNLTPESYISSVTTSSAPTPDACILRQSKVAAIAATMAQREHSISPGAGSGAASATAAGAAAAAASSLGKSLCAHSDTSATTSAAAAVAERLKQSQSQLHKEPSPPPQRQPSATDLSEPSMPAALERRLDEREDTQASVVGVSPVTAPARPNRTHPSAELPHTSSSLVSGTASSDTVPLDVKTLAVCTTRAAGRDGDGGVIVTGSGTTAGSANTAGPTSSSGRGGSGDGVPESASPGASWDWPWREQLSPRLEEALRMSLSPSTSGSSFLPFITPSTGSSAHMPLIRSSEASLAAAAAIQRAAMVVARAVSPARLKLLQQLDQQQRQQQQQEQQQQQQPAAVRSLSPSSVTGGGSSTPTSELHAILCLDEHGRPYDGQGRTAGVGTRGSRSSSLNSRTSLDKAVSQQVPLQPHPGGGGYVAGAAAKAVSEDGGGAMAAMGTSVGLVQQQQQPDDEVQPWEAIGVFSSTDAQNPTTRTVTSSRTDSWSSLQRSGLLGLSMPLALPAAPSHHHQKLQQQTESGKIAPSEHRYGPPTAGTSSATGPAGVDSLSTTSGLTSLTTISTFASHIAFTPAVRSYHSQGAQKRQPQLQQQQQQQHEPLQPLDATPISTISTTGSSSFSSGAAHSGPVSSIARVRATEDPRTITGSGTEFSTGSSGWPLSGDSRRSADCQDEVPGTGSGTAIRAAAANDATFSEYLRSHHAHTRSRSSPSGTNPSNTNPSSTPHASSVGCSSSDGSGAARQERSSDSVSGGLAALEALVRVAASAPTLFAGSAPAANATVVLRPGDCGMDAKLSSSSSAGFPPLRESSSNSAVLLGGVAHGATSSGVGAVVATAALARAYGSSFSSSTPNSENTGTVATAGTGSLRPHLGTLTGLYGSTSISSGTGTDVDTAAATGTRTGTGPNSGSGDSRFGVRSSITSSSRTAGTTSTSDIGCSSGGYRVPLAPMAASCGSSGLAELWSETAAAVAATAGGGGGSASSGSSADDVSEVLRLLRLSAKDDMGVSSSDERPLLRQPHSQPLPLPRPSHQQELWHEGVEDWADRGDPRDSPRDQHPNQHQQAPERHRMPSSISEPHSKSTQPVSGPAVGLAAGVSNLSRGPPPGHLRSSTDAVPLGFGSRVGSSTSSRHGSEPGLPIQDLGKPGEGAARAEGAAGGGEKALLQRRVASGAWQRSPVAVSSVPPTDLLRRASLDGRHARDQGSKGGDSEDGEEDDDDDDNDDDVDDASIAALATPYPQGRPSPGARGADDVPREPSPGGGGGGPGGGALHASIDGAASDLSASSPGNSNLGPLLGGYPTTPCGISELDATLRHMGITLWNDGSTAVDSLTPTTITDFTALYDDELGLMTADSRATDETASRSNY